MRFYRSIFAVMGVLGTHNVWAADQIAPADPSFHFSVDNNLRAQVPADILKRGYLIVGTNPNTPPTTFYKKDNKTLAGREIDILTAVADKLGLKVQWHDTGGFENIIPGLKSGRYDLAISNISATPERLKQADFINYFVSSRLAIISRKDQNIAPFTSLDVLCGKEVGAGVGTTMVIRLDEASKKCVVEGKPPIKTVIFPNRPAGVQATVSGRIPLYFGPFEGLTYQVSQIKSLVISGQVSIGSDNSSVALAKDSPLDDAVQNTLNSLMKDGSYQKILDKWNIGYGAVKEAKRNDQILNGI